MNTTFIRGCIPAFAALLLSGPAFAQSTNGDSAGGRPNAAVSGGVTDTMADTTTAPVGGMATIGSIEVSEAWTRQTPPRARAGGAYARITNTGNEPDTLIAGSAPFAGRVEIHEMAVTDGVMTMRELEDGLPIPPGETVELRPGSFHIMLLDMTEPPVEGGTVPLTLVFERAGEVTVDLPVAAIGAASLSGEGGGMGDMMDHGSMDHGSTASDGMEVDEGRTDMPTN